MTIFSGEEFYFSVSERKKYALGAVVVVVATIALIVGLTLGLRTPPPQNRPASTSLPTPEPTRALPRSPHGNYRFAAVAADGTECSTIGT